MKLGWRKAKTAPAEEPTVFDAVPVRTEGLFEWPPIPAPYQPKTVEELAAEAAARVLAGLDREGSSEPEPRT